MTARKLTIKQEKFCQSYIETGNASEAYRRAYSVGPNTKPNTVEKRACELLKNGKVAGRLADLRASSQQRHEITVDSITKMLTDAYDLAMKPDVASPSAAVAAALGLGKLHGLIIEKKHVKGEHNHQHDHQHRAVSETAEWIAGVLGGGSHRASAQPLPN